MADECFQYAVVMAKLVVPPDFILELLQLRGAAVVERKMSKATKPVFWSLTPEGVRVAVKVTPKARKTGLQGAVPSPDGPRLRIAVSEPPEDGKANQAVCATLAATLGVARSAVQVIAGASSRSKLLLVSDDPNTLVTRLASLG